MKVWLLSESILKKRNLTHTLGCKIVDYSIVSLKKKKENHRMTLTISDFNDKSGRYFSSSFQSLVQKALYVLLYFFVFEKLSN